MADVLATSVSRLNSSVVEILLVEDNETDAELCIDALRNEHLANNLIWLKDGADALDFIYCKGVYEGRAVHDMPNLILLDLRLPKIDGIEVLRELRFSPDAAVEKWPRWGSSPASKSSTTGQWDARVGLLMSDRRWCSVSP